MSLSDVAINSGFNSESYFCNTFKKYIGITPTEYRSINTFGENISYEKELRKNFTVIHM